MPNFATIDDLETLWRPLESSETEKADALLEIVSNELRYRAAMVGKDLDQMIEATPILSDVAKSVTVDVVKRTLQQSTEGDAMSQMSQSAGGYSISGTFLVPGGGIFIKKSELQRLGLSNQRIGIRDFYSE